MGICTIETPGREAGQRQLTGAAEIQKFCLVIPAAAPDRIAFVDRDIHMIITRYSRAHEVSVPRRPGRLFETVQRELGGR